MGNAVLYCSDERIADDKETTEIRSEKRSNDLGTKRRSNSSRSGCSLFKGSNPPEDSKGRPVLDMITTTPMDSELESESRSSDSLDPYEYRKVSVEYTCAPEGEPPKRKRVVNVLASPESSPKTSHKSDGVAIPPKASGCTPQKKQIKTILRNLRGNTSESESANFESYEEKRKESSFVEFEDSSSLAYSSSTEVVPSGGPISSKHSSGGQVITPGYPGSSGSSDCSGRKNDELRDEDDRVDDTTPEHGYESDAESRTATAAGDEENLSTDDGRKSSSAGSAALPKSPALRSTEADYGSTIQPPVCDNPYLLTGPADGDAESYDNQAIWSTMKGRSKAKFVMNPNWDESLMMTKERRLSCDDDNRSISRLSVWSKQTTPGVQSGTGGLCDDNISVRSGVA